MNKSNDVNIERQILYGISAVFIAGLYSTHIQHTEEKATCNLLAEGQAVTRAKMPKLFGIFDGKTAFMGSNLNEEIEYCWRGYRVAIIQESARRAIIATKKSGESISRRMLYDATTDVRP